MKIFQRYLTVASVCCVTFGRIRCCDRYVLMHPHSRDICSILTGSSLSYSWSRTSERSLQHRSSARIGISPSDVRVSFISRMLSENFPQIMNNRAFFIDS